MLAAFINQQTGDVSMATTVRKLRSATETAGHETARKAIGERLRLARVKAGYKTASDAARKLEIANPTYLAHENGTRAIRSHMAKEYAEAFGTTADWILYGRELAEALPAGREMEELSELVQTLDPTMRGIFLAHLLAMIRILRITR